MDVYEYMLVYITLGKDAKMEITPSDERKDGEECQIVDWVEGKNHNIYSSFKQIFVVTKTYETPKENHLEGKSTVLLTKQRAYYQDRGHGGGRLHGYLLSNSEQALVVLSEVFAKYGADGWHVVQSKLGEGTIPVGVAILERRVIQS